MKSTFKLPIILAVLGASALGTASATFAATKHTQRYNDQSYSAQTQFSTEIRDRDAQEGN